MIVELAGLPGSGKSTIARALARRDSTVHRELLPLDLTGAIVHPVGSLREALRWGGMGRATGWPAWPALWLRSIGQGAIRDRPGILHLLEEGTLHHLWRACFLHPALTDAPWAGLLGAPHPLVVLDLPAGERHGRILGKQAMGKVNRRLLESGPDGPAVSRGDVLFERLIAAAGRQRRVVRVSTAGPESAATDRVAAAIHSLT